MTTGYTLRSGVSSVDLDNVHQAALFQLRETNLLARTVRVFNDNGTFNPRDISRYNAANPREAGDGEDVTPTQFNRTNLATLTPIRVADQFLISDPRVASDRENVLADAAMELGDSFAEKVDTDIATLFDDVTGGTIGSAGGTITWSNLFSARAILHGSKVKGPYWCALHPYQWKHLLDATIGSVAASAVIVNAPEFNDTLVRDFYLQIPMLGGVTFVISANIAVDASDDAIGCMYAPMAMALDVRLPFTIAPERDESRQATELNANMWYAFNTWDAVRGVQLIGDATTPS
jgi:hypothetical protein